MTSTKPLNKCGRPTKSGAPCQNDTRPGFSVYNLGGDEELMGLIAQIAKSEPCGVHKDQTDPRTEVTRIIARVIKAAAETAREQERSYTEGLVRARVQQELQKARREASMRTRDHRGNQIVRVGEYAYTWDGDVPLKVGDTVMIPGNWLYKQPQQVEITGLGTDYTGPLSAIVRLVSRAA